MEVKCMKAKRFFAGLAAAAMCLSSIGLSSAAPSIADFFSESKITATADEEFVQYVKYTVDEDTLSAAGVSWQGSSKATVYVKMTEGGADSKINAMLKLGPDDETGTPVGKASSKYLSGRNVGSGNAIQDNLVGAAGTGIYAFPDVAFNKSIQSGVNATWQASYANEITITIRIDTPNTDCELLGIKFSNGAVYKADSSFDVSTVKTESTTYDVIATTGKELLKMSLDYCATMDSSKYQEESWTALQTQLAKAQAVYDKSGVTDSECTTARAELEKVKANMLFKDTGTESNPLTWRDLTNDEIVDEMGAGINLGNTMDGHSGFTPNETSWQSVTTTKAYIKALHDAGYNTVRIPVTWGTMIDEDNGYTINSQWISRVQDIVDYCVSQDMYAIINIHHDGAEQSGWLRVAADDIDSVYEEFECVWRNIAEYFKDYDEHLIFESMNEITSMEGDSKNSSEAIAYDTPIIVNLNQIFVNVVRSTGSNNTHRWLAAVSHYANTGTQSGFTLPTDSYNTVNRIMFAAHIYKSSTNTTWTYDEVYQVVSSLKSMANKHKVPLILGEYGTRTYPQSGTDSGYNDVARAYYSEIVNRACQVAGCVPIVWDQGYGSDKYEKGLFSYWNRTDCEPIFKTITDAMMRGTYLTATSSNTSWNFKDITENPTIVPITEITPSDSTVTLSVGDTYTVTAQTSPSNTNDVVLWSTDDDTVATVSQGKIRAKGVGITTVRVYSQDGDVSKEITVKVNPNGTATTIECDSEYTVTTGKSITLNPTTDTAAQLTYKSTDESIATVNALGKVVGVKNGTAYVVITADSGVTKTVKIIVSDVDSKNEMNVALHVLYNDDTKGYYGCETGTPVTVNGDGTYTVTFDLSKDLSKAGSNAGITEINKLTSIYIKDIDVTNGDAKKSPVTSAKIRYDSVKVNGTELTLNQTDFVNKTLNGTTFDTGEPVNAWDGSYVDEVSSSNHVASFTSVTKPTTIEVTFTLSDVVFNTSSASVKNEATKLKAVTAKKVVLANVGDTQELTVEATPVYSDSVVSFISADSSVAAVDVTATDISFPEGTASAVVTAMAEGKTTVMAMTENGLVVEFEIIVGEDDSADDENPADTPSDDEENGGDDNTGDTPADDNTDDENGGDGNTDNTPTDSDNSGNDNTDENPADNGDDNNTDNEDGDTAENPSDDEDGDSDNDGDTDTDTDDENSGDSDDTDTDSDSDSDNGNGGNTATGGTTSDTGSGSATGTGSVTPAGGDNSANGTSGTANGTVSSSTSGDGVPDTGLGAVSAAGMLLSAAAFIVLRKKK
jgi:endoglucanase